MKFYTNYVLMSTFSYNYNYINMNLFKKFLIKYMHCLQNLVEYHGNN